MNGSVHEASKSRPTIGQFTEDADRRFTLWMVAPFRWADFVQRTMIRQAPLRLDPYSDGQLAGRVPPSRRRRRGVDGGRPSAQVRRHAPASGPVRDGVVRAAARLPGRPPVGGPLVGEGGHGPLQVGGQQPGVARRARLAAAARR